MSNNTTSDHPSQIVIYSSRERIRNVITIGLLQYDYHIIDTSNPYIAVMKITQVVPDLVIIDITETNTKGFLIVNALKRSEQTKDIPVLVIMPGEPPDLLDTIIHEYSDKNIHNPLHHVSILTYPFNFSLLVDRVKTILTGNSENSQ